VRLSPRVFWYSYAIISPLNVKIATFFTGNPVKFIKIDKLIENKIISTGINFISTRRNTEKRKGK